jgi:hypothetical protein
MIPFAHRPVVTVERAIDAKGPEGVPITGEALAARIKAAKEAEDQGKTAPAWDQDILFPRLTCGCRRLRFTDMAGLEELRRHAAQHGVGIVLAGAYVGNDDLDVLRAVWPDLVEKRHPYPDRKIKQIAIVALEGHHGPRVLIGPEGKLVTYPLEGEGELGLIFCARQADAIDLYDAVSLSHGSARLVIGNDEEIRWRRNVHRDELTKVFITYSRGVLGVGANIKDVLHMVIDCEAFRHIASFTPGELTPEAFEQARFQERVYMLLQNVGRALRGEEGKRVVIFLLNAEPEFLKLLETSPDILQACELPPVMAQGPDLTALVEQADRWLEAGGGPWPEPIPGKGKKRAKPGRSRKTKAEVLVAAESALAKGQTWRAFCRSHRPQHNLTPEESATLKGRFDANRP